MGFAKIVEYGAFFYRQLFFVREADFNPDRLINLNYNNRNIFINDIDHNFIITSSIMKEFSAQSKIYL